MSMVKTYWRQGVGVLTTVILGKALSLLWKILLARLGPESFGTVEIALSTFFTLSSFSLLGFHTALMRFVAIASASRSTSLALALLRFSVTLALALSLLVVACFSLFPNILPTLITASSETIADIGRFLWIVPILTASEIIWAYFAATKRVGEYGIMKYMLSPAFRLVGLLVLIGLRIINQFTLLLHLGIASLLALLIASVLVRNHKVLPYADWRIKKQFLTFSFTMSGSFVAFVLYGVLDVFFVARFLGPVSVGLLAAIGILTKEVLDAVLGPILNIFQTNLGSAYRNITKGLTFTLTNIGIFLLAGTAMGWGIYITRHLLIRLILGSAYGEVAPFIVIFFALHLLETAIILPLRHFLDFYGHVKTTLMLMVVVLVIKAAVGLVTVPTYGLWGIALAQLMSITVHLIGAAVVSVAVARQESVK